MTDRLKIFASVYACDPYLGSEDGVGWNWVQQIASQHDVWAITWAENREPIERYTAEHPDLPHVNWVYYELPRWVPLRRNGKKRERAHYQLWQIGIYFLARKLHREIGFDIAHHITFAQYWTATYLALLPVPFVWGPVGGGESAPKSFYETFTPLGKRYEWLRDTARMVYEWHPFVGAAARRSDRAIAVTRESAARMKKLGAKTIDIKPTVALSDDEYAQLSQMPARAEGPFRMFSMGRLLHWKGFHLGLMGFARYLEQHPDSEAEYWIVGDGPDREYLQEMAQSLKIADHVKFLGRIPRSEVLERLSECDALVHPSLHDSGGLVCLEAMAAGRPVICLDIGGPALIVSDTGMVVAADNPEVAINGIADAIHKLAANPDMRAQLAEAGRARVRDDFSWQNRGEYITQVYAELQAKAKEQLATAYN